MQTLAFRVFTAGAVVASAALHVYSYFREVPSAVLTTAVTCAILLFLALVAASFWDVRGKKLPEAWNEHLRAAMAASPLLLQFIFLFAWASAAVAIARTMLNGISSFAHFHTAWCLGVSVMALSFAIGTRRINRKNA